MGPAVGDWLLLAVLPLPTIAQCSAGGSTAEGVVLQPEGLVVGNQGHSILFVSGKPRTLKGYSEDMGNSQASI